MSISDPRRQSQGERCEFRVLEKGSGWREKNGVTGRWMVFEAMNMGEIIKGVNMDRKDKRTTITVVTLLLRIIGEKRMNK